MRLNLIDKVIFDGSTNPGTVELNGWRLKFDSDEDAKDVFDLLTQIHATAAAIQQQIRKVSMCVDRLMEMLS